MEPGNDDSNKSIVDSNSENEDSFDSSDDDEEDSDFELDLLRNLEDVETTPLFPCLQEPYKVMSEAEIRQCQERDVNTLTEFLTITTAEAFCLLLHFNWDVNAIPEAWFKNGQELREKLGFSDVPIDGAESSNAKDMACRLCSGTFSQELIAAALCGHKFCKPCWAGYIGTSVKDGKACLMLRCPEPHCTSPVGKDMINMLASKDDKDAYAGYFLRSFIEYNPKAKWCPASGCKYAVILESGCSGSKVTCECSNSFCFKCAEEPHQPISCAALMKWQVESSVQSENWVIGKNKGCPNCGKLVEVKGRQKRLECSSCKFQFCKLCLICWLEESDWEHVCSEVKLKKPVIEEEEEKMKVAEQRLNRYNLRQLQWETNDKHILADREEIQKLLNGQLKEIADKQGLTEADMCFIKEAWLQNIECKRFFKWAAVYDFYLKDGENDKRILFHYLLRRAEIIMERLYQCASEWTKFLNMESPEEFGPFRARLNSLTWVNKNYFNNMGWAMENRLNMKTLRPVMESRMLGVNVSAAQKNGRKRAFNDTELWNCAWCQFENVASVWTCVMCYHP